MFFFCKTLCITVLKYQYFICTPLFLISIWARFGINSTSFRHMLPSSSLWYHIWITARSNLSMVVQSVFISRCFPKLHKFSMRLRSGEFHGQCNIFTPSFWKKIKLQLFRSVADEIILLKHTISMWVKFLYFCGYIDFPNNFIFSAIHHPHNYS